MRGVRLHLKRNTPRYMSPITLSAPGSGAIPSMKSADNQQQPRLQIVAF